jgi:hypothetical protein
MSTLPCKYFKCAKFIKNKSTGEIVSCPRESNCKYPTNLEENFFHLLNWDQLGIEYKNDGDRRRVYDLFSNFLPKISSDPTAKALINKLFHCDLGAPSTWLQYDAAKRHMCNDIILGIKIRTFTDLSNLCHISIHNDANYYQESRDNNFEACRYPVENFSDACYKGTFHYCIENLVKPQFSGDYLPPCDMPHKLFSIDENAINIERKAKFLENDLPFIDLDNMVSAPIAIYEDRNLSSLENDIFVLHNTIYNLFVQYWNDSIQEKVKKSPVPNLIPASLTPAAPLALSRNSSRASSRASSRVGSPRTRVSSPRTVAPVATSVAVDFPALGSQFPALGKSTKKGGKVKKRKSKRRKTKKRKN